MAGKPIKTKTIAVNDTGLPRIEKEIYKCPSCGEKYPNQEKNFYKSSSIVIKANNNRMVVCKKCVVDLYSYLVKKYDNTKTALYFLCRLTDTYFDSGLYPSVEQQATNSNSNIAGIYFQKINSLPQYVGKTFFDSTPIELIGEKTVFEIEDTLSWTEEDKRNKNDVIRMVGYDPFENENPLDKKSLYNSLVDMLDDSTLEDSFKLPIVIEISKSFNQIDKINQALALITSDISSISNQVGGVKSLIDAKNTAYRAILAMAKDNGISVNHSNNKSKGAGTLSGIMKKLQEKGFMEVEVNLYDIETCQGMRQVADMSNESIRRQLQFDENDYTTMINEQRELIDKLDSKSIALEEELRLLKIKSGVFANG